jgi:transcriptional antiterminator RfaH
VTEFDRYAVQIRTRSEAVAFASLDYYGFESYCPQVKTWRQYSDRLKFVTEPVSLVHLFCRFDLLSKSKVFSSNTLERVVGFGAQAAPVSTSEIEAIRRMIDEGDATASIPRRGERVRVIAGFLQGIEGVLVRESASLVSLFRFSFSKGPFR